MGLPFAEADRFHPTANIANMSAGTPLTDDDRWPGSRTSPPGWQFRREGAVHRHGLLGAAPDLPRRPARRSSGVQFVHLHGPEALIAARMSARPDHFMLAAPWRRRPPPSNRSSPTRTASSSTSGPTPTPSSMGRWKVLPALRPSSWGCARCWGCRRTRERAPAGLPRQGPRRRGRGRALRRGLHRGPRHPRGAVGRGRLQGARVGGRRPRAERRRRVPPRQRACATGSRRWPPSTGAGTTGATQPPVADV